jgi:glycosyltransferase involved in cell wall biosynthesis
MPTAVVIIPHYNDMERLARCLAALHPQLTADVQAVVVDNASNHPLDALSTAYPNITFLTEDRKGAAMARNRGVAATTAPHLFFLDCDCVPDADWVTTAMAICDQADVIGGTITVFDETPPPRSGAEAFEAVFAFDNRGYILNKGFSVTANLLTHRRVFDATGDFRGGLSEDLDWCHRATSQGFVLVHDERLRVGHPTRSDWSALRSKWKRLTQEAWGLQGADPAARVRWGLRAIAMPVSVLAHTPRVLRTNRLDGPAERKAALLTLLRLRLARCGWMLKQALTQSAL